MRIGVKDNQPIRAGDWTVEIDGQPSPQAHLIQSADDVEEWYDYLSDIGNPPEGRDIEQTDTEFVTRRRYCRVSLIYHGTDPQFSQFKKPATTLP